MCIAGPEEAGELLKHHEMIKVATKYPRIARDYFHNIKVGSVINMEFDILGKYFARLMENYLNGKINQNNQ